MGAVTGWYATAVAWWAPFERDARRSEGDRISVHHQERRLTYRHCGLEVPGHRKPIPVAVHFYAEPPYPCFGLAAEDYPRVFAEIAETSEHRMPDGSLCLFYPGDPDDRRWRSQNGLGILFELARRHLFLELHWRRTGGPGLGEWLGDEAPHGVPRKRAA